MKDPNATTFPEWIGQVQRRLNRLERIGYNYKFAVEATQSSLLAVETVADIPEELPVDCVVYVVREQRYIQQDETTRAWVTRSAP